MGHLPSMIRSFFRLILWSLFFGRLLASTPLSLPESTDPPLPSTAFACASSVRGSASARQLCVLNGKPWDAWKRYQEEIGDGMMSFPHPLDRFYATLGVPMGVPPMV